MKPGVGAGRPGMGLDRRDNTCTKLDVFQREHTSYPSACPLCHGIHVALKLEPVPLTSQHHIRRFSFPQALSYT